MTGDCVLQGTFGNVWRCLWLSRLVGGRKDGGAAGVQRAEAGDAAKHNTMCRAALTAKDYSAPNVSSAQDENLQLTCYLSSKTQQEAALAQESLSAFPLGSLA